MLSSQIQIAVDHSFWYRYLVMPLMQMDLHTLIFEGDRKALSEDQIQYITYQILRGLQVFHLIF